MRPKKACESSGRKSGWARMVRVAWRRYIDIGGVAAQKRKRVGVLVLHRLRYVDDHNVATVVAAGKEERRGEEDRISIKWQAGGKMGGKGGGGGGE